MSAIRLEPRGSIDQRLDLSPLNPDRLTTASVGEIEKIPLALGSSSVPAGELFRLTVEDSELPRLEIGGSTDRFDAIGEGLRHGHIEVAGNAGAWLGRNMKGGEIRVSGSCGPFAASGLAGGHLLIDGDAGDFLAAPEPGLRGGMRGGRVIVRGSVGDRAGDHLRRGTIFVEGGAGAYCGSRMVAGTLAVLGPVGEGLGFGMRRGSLLLGQSPVGLPPTFNDAGETRLDFLRLWARAWGDVPEVARGFLPTGDRARRWVGDLAVDGRGEVLLLPEA